MNSKFKFIMVFTLVLTACSGLQSQLNSQSSPRATEAELGAMAATPTEGTLDSASITITGTVADASPSAGLIMLMEPVDGFEVIAVIGDTVLIDENGNELRMNEIKRGMYVKAQGAPGQGSSFIASHVHLFRASGLPYPTHPVLLTYIGPDGNVWVYNKHEQAPVLVTTEASESSAISTIEFRSPRISSDGTLIAVQRQERSHSDAAIEVHTSLLVYEVSNRSATEVYDRAPAGFDWKPGSHILAYSPVLDDAYFSARGQVDSDYATSVLGYDHDTGATTELVRPVSGFALIGPTWSPTGRFLSFEEVQGYGASGWFAYYDFETDRYAGWGRTIGNYDWAPDEKSIVYDELIYTASGTEVIRLADREGSTSRQISPDFNWGYTTQPAFSPEGDQITYLYHSSKGDRQPTNVYVQQVSGGQPIDLGAFEHVRALDWTADGQALVMEAAGPSGQQEILVLQLNSSEIDGIAVGTNLGIAHCDPAGEGISDWMAAERALQTFFENLSGGNYAAAVDLYGGSFSTMRDHNPTIDEDDLAALLQAACEINGAQCLATAHIRPNRLDDLSEGEFLFTVQFIDENGSLFTRGPCCGEDSGSDEPVSEFKFKVRKESEYHFVVLDPPMYSP